MPMRWCPQRLAQHRHRRQLQLPRPPQLRPLHQELLLHQERVRARTRDLAYSRKVGRDRRMRQLVLPVAGLCPREVMLAADTAATTVMSGLGEPHERRKISVYSYPFVISKAGL